MILWLPGTRIGEESYKAGTKMTNIVLEILNLQKKEDVTVDLVSNQDFTEVVISLQLTFRCEASPVLNV